MNLVGREEFISELIQSFPELREEVEDEIISGLLHLEMASFARCTQDAIERGEFDRLIQYYKFADRFYRNANGALKNAFYVSYLENLNFDSPNGTKGKTLLPSALLQGWVDINKYLEELGVRSLKPEKKKRK